MEFIINPYVGAGEIFLGMTSRQIQDALAVKPEKFKKVKDAEYDTDDFGCCHVYYKRPRVCEAIEFFEPAEVVFMGHNLIGQPFKDVEKLFKKYDPSVEFNDSGLTSYQYCTGIYAPYDLVEGVIVFEKGYYD